MSCLTMSDTEMDRQVKKIELDECGGRRRSQRIGGKKVCYNEKVKLSVCGEISPKKTKTKQPRSKKPQPQPQPPVAAEPLVSEEMVKSLIEQPTELGGGLMGLTFQLGGVDDGQWSEQSDHLKVKKTLRAFNYCYLHCIQEEEKRCKTQDEQAKKSSNGKIVKSSKRPDLKAANMMRASGKILYCEKQIGAIRGVDVGHQFFSRCEMVSVGFHSHWLNGIDFMGNEYSKMFSEYTFPLAVAIVMSGQYEDDVDNKEEVIYTGQGGHDLLGNKKQIKDQVMKNGNLALKNSMLCSVPVRVIRGHQSKSSYVGKVYTYDGLYNVVNYWAEKGISGFTVFKFRLKRVEGQPALTTAQVQFIRGQNPFSIANLKGVVCEDISGGLENKPIPMTNEVGDSAVFPTGFTYRTSVQVSSNVKIPASTVGCGCKGRCDDPRICACARLNGSVFPYVVDRQGARLVEAKAVVFECGPKCACGPACINRTSQKGIQFQFEVFRTSDKGWGVRSWDHIPAGALICEYTGILKRSDDAENALDYTYIFDIDCLQTMKGLEGRERRVKDVSLPSEALLEEKIVDGDPEFCLDALTTGNFSRFINHSCEPNLFIQCVLSCHQDVKLARVVLFAADNIPPLQELSYDYGYALDSVLGPDGKFKQMPCTCGAASCRKRLY